MADAARTTASANPYAQPGEHPRLDWHLDNWAQYMRDGGLEELDCKAADIWSGAFIVTFDEMADNMEQRCAMAFDALVGGLPIDERIAVHHVHLGAVFRLKRQSMDDVYKRARLGLSEGLGRRGIA